MIDQTDWEWFGLPGHFICAEWCRFHLCTLIGDTLVSTVGKYVHPKDSQGGERGDVLYLIKNPNGAEIGFNRHYETMAFKALGKRCDAEECNCGMPQITGDAIVFKGYNNPGDATRGHHEVCMKVAMEVSHE